MTQAQAILVLPHLRIQNANAIASPLTHGFPSITAFTGVMWALERKLAQAGVPLQLHGVGVVGGSRHGGRAVRVAGAVCHRARAGADRLKGCRCASSSARRVRARASRFNPSRA